MVFEFKTAVGGLAERANRSKIVNKVMSNTVFAALLITAITAIIILALYQNTSVRAGGPKKAVQAAIYLLLFLSAVIFLHHYALERRLRRELGDEKQRSILASIQGGQVGPSRFDVQSAPRAPYLGAGYDEQTRAFSGDSGQVRRSWEGVGEPLPHSHDGREPLKNVTHGASLVSGGAPHTSGSPTSGPPASGPLNSGLPLISDIQLPSLRD